MCDICFIWEKCLCSQLFWFGSKYFAYDSFFRKLNQLKSDLCQTGLGLCFVRELHPFGICCRAAREAPSTMLAWHCPRHGTGPFWEPCAPTHLHLGPLCGAPDVDIECSTDSLCTGSVWPCCPIHCLLKINSLIHILVVHYILVGSSFGYMWLGMC